MPSGWIWRAQVPDGSPRHGLGERVGPVIASAAGLMRSWAVPMLITLMALVAFAALYLGGILKPVASMRHFPVAVVNEDSGPLAGRIVNTLSEGLDKNKFDIRTVSREDFRHQMDTAQLYGAVLIPQNFSATVQKMVHSATGEGKSPRPTVVIVTNPRASVAASGIAGETLSHAMAAVSRKLGQQLAPVAATVAQQQEGATIDRAALLMLANPVDIETRAYNPLPEGTGNGMSAFYYAMLLLLAGVTAGIMVTTLRGSENPTAFQSTGLLANWALILLLALPTSGLYLAIARAFGMPVEKGWPLWLYGVFVVAAVGIVSTSLIVVFGPIGVLASLFLFVILGLPSLGTTVPLESQPAFYRWLANFEPMHHVFLGARALLYLDGRADAGLAQALAFITSWLAIGIVLGVVVHRLQDRRDRRRTHTGFDVAEIAESDGEK